MSENDDNYIENLELFINNCENDLNKLINEKIGWSRSDVNINSTVNKCPFNDHHSNISNYNYEKHVNKCYLISKNYTNDDIREFYKQVTINSPYHINIGEQQEQQFKCFKDNNNDRKSSQNETLNLFSYKQQICSLNSEEKLKNYEFALNHFRKFNIKGFSSSNEKTYLDLSEFDVKTNTNESKKSSDYADILAELQDRKRRTKSYKTSGSKKSYTDKMRELIESQMEMLEEINKLSKEKQQQQQERISTTKKKRSKSRDDSNDSNSSSDSHHHHKKHKKHHKKHHKHKHKKHKKE